MLVCVGVAWVKLGPVVREWWSQRKEREERLNFGELCVLTHLEDRAKSMVPRWFLGSPLGSGRRFLISFRGI